MPVTVPIADDELPTVAATDHRSVVARGVRRDRGGQGEARRSAVTVGHGDRDRLRLRGRGGVRRGGGVARRGRRGVGEAAVGADRRACPSCGVGRGERQRVTVEIDGGQDAGDRSGRRIGLRHRGLPPPVGAAFAGLMRHGDRDVDDAAVPVVDRDGEGVLSCRRQSAIELRRGVPCDRGRGVGERAGLAVIDTTPLVGARGLRVRRRTSVVGSTPVTLPVTTPVVAFGVPTVVVHRRRLVGRADVDGDRGGDDAAPAVGHGHDERVGGDA